MDEGKKEKGEEIKVTPQMIEAGLRHLYAYHPEHGVDGADTIRRIFVAMRALQCSKDR